jgi:hypothetical protein
MLQEICRDYKIRNEFLATFLLLLSCYVLNQYCIVFYGFACDFSVHLLLSYYI